MFIRKLFNVGDKAKWLILELLIVFVGVYLAFLFQSYSEQAKIESEKRKVSDFEQRLIESRYRGTRMEMCHGPTFLSIF